MRVVERLVGDEAVYIRRFNAGVIEASPDALEMKRMRARLRSLADLGFTDADNGVPAADMTPGYLRTNCSPGFMNREASLTDPNAPSLHTPAGRSFQLIRVKLTCS